MSKSVYSERRNLSLADYHHHGFHFEIHALPRLSKFRLAKPVTYFFDGGSVEQVKLLASLVSPVPLYHAFCG